MKYYVQVQWCRPSSKCYIGHASEDDEQFDGDNFCGSGDGFKFCLYDDLKTAIEKSNYLASKITFLNFTKEEMVAARKIVDNLMADPTYLKRFKL